MHKRIGVIVRLQPDGTTLDRVSQFGLHVCQPCCWNPDHYTDDCAQRLLDASRDTGIRLNALWAGWPGPKAWNFREGPATLGLIPPEFREARVSALMKAGAFAARLQVPAIITHLGYIPENPNDPVFDDVVNAVRGIAEHLKDKGLEFWFETGQETPVTLLQLIESVGTGNLGVNLDPANLILYGKANPIDALDVFGQHVRCVHAKDGMYPTDPMELGKEVKVGTGKVCFPAFVKALNHIGYTGDYIIEREIHGDEQAKDIRETITYLTGLI